MDYRKLMAGAMVFAMLAAAGCDEKTEESSSASSSSVSESSTPAEDSTPEEASKVEATEAPTEAPTAPSPVEASDPNSVTFDDDDCSFAEVITDDDASAVGTLSVVDVKGNKMLKFTDDGSVDIGVRVQKVKIHVNDLIGAENLDKVKSIEFDVYGDATADLLVTEDGANVKAPGWIGGGGGSVTAKNEKWYDFGEFSGDEYTFDMSGAIHAEFKFLLAADNQKWSNDMEDASFLIMRWGMQNEGNLYIDNIVFYDEEGNSIPLTK